MLLNGFLLLVSLCTAYVMLASAVYRMVLYVQQYPADISQNPGSMVLAMLFVLMAGW